MTPYYYYCRNERKEVITFEFSFEWDSCNSGAGFDSFEARTIDGIIPYLNELMTMCCPWDMIEVSAWNEDTGSEWTFHVSPLGWDMVDSIVNDA